MQILRLKLFLGFIRNITRVVLTKNNTLEKYYVTLLPSVHYIQTENNLIYNAVVVNN